MRERFGSRSAIVALIAMTLAVFLYVTTEALPIGLLPSIAKDLGTSASAVGLLVTAYGLIIVVATLPLTRLARRLPRRRLLCLLLAVFVVATCLSAVAWDYWLLMAARMVTALSQAVFWAVVTPAVAGLFRAEARGRAVSILYAGASTATLAGIPAGTWLGQQTDWRTAFLALSGLGLLALVTVMVALPGMPPGQGAAERGSAPDRGRYLSIVATTAVAVTGAFTALTYISPFLTGVSGFAESSVGPLLLVRGIAGLAGVFVVGYLIDRHGWLTMTGLVGLQALALAGQYAFGASQVATVVAISLSGFTLAGLTAALGARVLVYAPGESVMASAATSTAFNVGITVGAFLGSVLLPGPGPRGTVLVGALLSLAAFAVVLAEPRFAHRPKPAGEPLLETTGVA
ncbi:MFS transporter [Nonomuraea jiangxiensis]|uniref:MFS transporter, DHA1 family, inner membrane transport protein n=1 Tax=Nonomuraea jiangxiensis TaxID=633440 RepID=A0A1G9UVP3_9ACTN|nr:MFS transporter [Nonomuraea jiangxiensis]SDM63993.1 MFS transporter, DHA1 family, inner membrane transport protein [Nonomuraea jiangxiensis]